MQGQLIHKYDINHLPNEVLYMILNHLHTHTQNLDSIMRVSKLWYYLLKCIKSNQKKIISFCDYDENIGEIDLHQSSINIMERKIVDQILNFVHLGNHRYLIHSLSGIGYTSNSSYLIYIIDCNNNQLTYFIAGDCHANYDIYVTQDRSRFAILCNPENNKCKNLTVYNSFTMKVIKKRSIPAELYVHDQNLSVLDKILIVDQRITLQSSLNYPLYLLDIKMGKMNNIKIKIPDELKSQLSTFLNHMQYVFTKNGNLCCIGFNKKVLILDTSNINSVALLNYIKLEMEFEHLKLSNKDDKLFLFPQQCCQLHDYDESPNNDNNSIDINILDLMNGTIKTISNMPRVQNFDDYTLILEKHVTNVIERLNKIKLENSSYEWDKDYNGIYLSYYLPNSICTDSFVITSDSEDLLIIDKFTNQIVSQIKADNGFKNMNYY